MANPTESDLAGGDGRCIALTVPHGVHHTVPAALADGETAPIELDDRRRTVVAGAGTAGTPAGGVHSVQGVAGGTAVPASVAALPLPAGAATETSLGTDGAGAPAQGTGGTGIRGWLASIYAAFIAGTLLIIGRAQRTVTTLSQAALGYVTLQVSRVGSLFIHASIRHERRLHRMATAAGAYTTFASLPEGPCDALRIETVGAGACVFGQPVERSLIASQDGSAWTCADATWTRVGNVWTHVPGAGNTTPLVYDTTANDDPVVVGWAYAMVYRLASYVAGSVTYNCGTTAGAARSAAGADYIELLSAAANQTISIVPTATFDGSIDVTRVWCFPRMGEMPTLAWDPHSMIKVVAATLATTPTTWPGTPINVWAGWYRRPGATEQT